MKKVFYAMATTWLLAVSRVSAGINPDWTTINPGLTTQGTADQVIQQWIVNVMWFLALVAIVYGLWWGFNILTAGWDEDKVKNWKTVIINSLIWIVVIFLVGTIVRWLIDLILK